MKLYTYQKNGAVRVGAGVDETCLLDLAAAFPLIHGRGCAGLATLQSLIEAGEPLLKDVRSLLAAAPEEAIDPIAGVRLLAPIPRPLKIRGFSVFERHLRQATEGAWRRMASGDPDPEAAYQRLKKSSNLESLTGAGWRATPGYYHSDHSTVVGPNETVVWPSYSNWIDYELELVAVIGTTGKDIPKDRAMDHVFGYTILNDLSARDAQFKAMATGLGVGKGKDFDGSNPMGPCIVTADEIPNPYTLTLRTRVNGEEKSCVSSAEAYWTFADCIAHASMAQTIHAGEMFSTGCAPDCCSLEQGFAVNRGDVIELEIEKIGVLRTTIG